MDTQKIIESEKKHIMQTYKRDIVIDHGVGCYLFDKNGTRYLDMVGGIATCILGHGNAKFADCVRDQIKKVTNPTNLYYTEQQVILAQKLSNLSGISKCFFSNSGTESIEAAIKLARRHSEKTYPKRFEIISAINSFHGRTFGALAATGKDKIKAQFSPMLEGFCHVEFGKADAVEKTITKKTCAVIVEPVQGEAGIIIPTKDYIKNLREICDRHKILLILDEVQTGCARTGKFFAYEHSKIKPDIVTLAKGLANGIPIGATIAQEQVASSFEKGDHGSTFGGNPVACCAANFTIDCIVSKKLMLNAQMQGDYLIGKLKSISSPLIKEVRGIGLMAAIEIKDKENAEDISKKCANEGLLVNITAEKVIRFLPPLTIGKNEIDEAIEILRKVMKLTE